MNTRNLPWLIAAPAKPVIAKRDDAAEFANPRDPKLGLRKPKVRLAKPKKTKLSKVAASVLETGATEIPKYKFIEAITKRAAKLQTEGETAAQAFARVITSDEKARMLFKASKVAHGPDIRPPPMPVMKAVEPTNAAYQTVKKLADDYRTEMAALGKHYTPEQAFAKVFADPANGALRSEIRAEHMNTALRQSGFAA